MKGSGNPWSAILGTLPWPGFPSPPAKQSCLPDSLLALPLDGHVKTPNSKHSPHRWTHTHRHTHTHTDTHTHTHTQTHSPFYLKENQRALAASPSPWESRWLRGSLNQRGLVFTFRGLFPKQKVLPLPSVRPATLRTRTCAVPALGSLISLACLPGPPAAHPSCRSATNLPGALTLCSLPRRQGIYVCRDDLLPSRPPSGAPWGLISLAVEGQWAL